MRRPTRHVRRQTDQVVLRAAQSLLQETNRMGREVGGVLVQTADRRAIRIINFDATGTRFSIPPHCGGQREDRHKVPGVGTDEVRVAEFHTHPRMPEYDLAPPSSPDLYQLMLACAKQEYNLAYVIAAEGVYICEINLRVCRPVMQDLLEFLRLNDYTEADSQSVIRLFSLKVQMGARSLGYFFYQGEERVRKV